MDSGPRLSSSPLFTRSRTSGALPTRVSSYSPLRISSWVTPPHPVRAADEVAGVLLGEVLDAERCRHAEVDRLAGEVCERLQRGPRELDETLARVTVREAEQDGAGRHAPVARPLDEAAALEC